MVSKNLGKPILEFDDFTIYAKYLKAKRKGKDRIWISIRQNKSKDWRVAASLSYVNSIDVRFEKEKDIF